MLIQARDGTSDGENKKLGWQQPWDQSFVLALDKATGKPRWKGARGLSRIAHVAPVIWTDEQGRTFVLSGAGNVVQGFDAKTGERVWSSWNEGEGVVPSLAAGGGLVFSASGWIDQHRQHAREALLGERRALAAPPHEQPMHPQSYRDGGAHVHPRRRALESLVNQAELL